jgi:hypothetical protein
MANQISLPCKDGGKNVLACWYARHEAGRHTNKGGERRIKKRT